MQLRNSSDIRPMIWVLVGIAIIAVSLFSFIGLVEAKGPESVIITGPRIDKPIELLDAANTELISKLMEQTGLWFATGDLPQSVEKPAGKLGPGYTLTWINSGPPDKSKEERTIRQLIYLEAENGPVIHTPAQKTLQGWGPERIGWFAAPSGLRDTLTELGVPISGATPFSEIARELPANTTLSPPRSANTNWALAIVGLALVIGLAGARGCAND